MEFDVLNEILTETCSRLLSPKPVYSFRREAQQQNYTQPSQASVNVSRTSVNSNQSASSLPLNQEQTLENWIAVIGPQKLQQSLKKLNIDLPKLTKKDLEVQSFDQLQNEKKRVKNELKSYDAAFQNIFGRFPNRNEKEPMRPLYIYYKKLKQYIDKAPQPPPQPVQQRVQQAPQQNAGYMSQAEIAKKIEELKRSRSELRDKLNNFQNEFSNLHHRKIRFHRDIAPVEKEYKMYKDIKQEIQKLESMLKK